MTLVVLALAWLLGVVAAALSGADPAAAVAVVTLDMIVMSRFRLQKRR